MKPKYQDKNHSFQSSASANAKNEDWTSKAKRISVIVGLALTFIGLIAKAYEVIPAIGRSQQLNQDLDKVYERTHRELDNYSQRP